MNDQKVVDNMLAGNFPPDMEPGGWKELWAIMTDEQRDVFTRTHFGVPYGTPITDSMCTDKSLLSSSLD